MTGIGTILQELGARCLNNLQHRAYANQGMLRPAAPAPALGACAQSRSQLPAFLLHCGQGTSSQMAAAAAPQCKELQLLLLLKVSTFCQTPEIKKDLWRELLRPLWTHQLVLPFYWKVRLHKSLVRTRLECG